MDITKAKAGRKVIYTPFEGCDRDLLEEGVITSFNECNIFVRFGSDIHSQACTPSDLKYATPPY